MGFAPCINKLKEDNVPTSTNFAKIQQQRWVTMAVEEYDGGIHDKVLEYLEDMVDAYQIKSKEHATEIINRLMEIHASVDKE